jgi:Type IV secretion-system coupling protein DNA-binding domain
MQFPNESIISRKIKRNERRSKAVTNLALSHSLILGENNHQGKIHQVSLSNDQRTKHLHLIGSSGSGKSTLLLNLIKQDLVNNQGLCVIDPHGDLIDEVISNVPDSRLKDVIIFDPSDSEFPIGFNILQANSELEKNLLSSDLVATFRRMATSWGDVMDSVLANSILAFVESSKGGTLFDLRRFLVEKEFRNDFLKTVLDESVKYFWTHEFPNIAGKPQSSILIRLDSFMRNKLVRNIVCQKHTTLDFRKVMDNKKVLLIKLSQGLIGEENAYLLGTLLVSKLYQTALSRQDSQSRPYFWLYLDEFQHFITPSMESILSGVRKYNIGLHLAHQEFRQLQSRSLEVASSVLSNCYTRICFRLGDNDAEKFASGFSFFDGKALQNLGIGEAIGRVERAEFDFNLKTSRLPKVEKELAEQRKQAILENTRNFYSKPREEVESGLFENLTRKESEPKQTTATEIKAKLIQPKGPVYIQPKAEDQRPKTKDQVLISELDNSHRYLQGIIKRIGESNGFVATLEKQVFGGIGKVDVALESETVKIAVEVAATNTVEYEVQNIQKCLASGFDKVVVISNDTKHLANIKNKVELIVAETQLSKVSYLEPEHFHLFLEKLNNESENRIKKETKVKGYKVNVSYKEASQSELDAKEQAIAEILKDAERRRK